MRGVLVGFLGFLALMVGVAVSMISGGGGATTSANDVTDEMIQNVGDVNAQFSAVQNGWDKMVRLKVLPSAILFNGAPQFTGTSLPAARVTTPATTAKLQIFDPDYGYVKPAPVPPANASASSTSTDRNYIYRSNFSLQSGSQQAGTSAAEVIMVLPLVKAGLCMAYNNQVWGDALSSDPATDVPSAALTQAQLIGTTAMALTVSLNQTIPRDKGCMKTSDATPSYFVYYILQAN